ncbi:Amylo-alpha-16-glucosidase [Pseudopedobacter saltans DSM 12145]|uniref:beta-fructofuranosidase n=1 Tax=Pseudopedobacter saltans (strain ATCC 51119 / DSM 12145 / JCM 21818 / CCUG 39354 / LMG 10337 / NBRC 100064 / NCIMB 13643) TaxID=762903 RepID=F0S864_PSESL|nr:glycoside hydrolase 100 family protein [Pseudopedobacter saltans]ADY52326.1 Amylo-alpha-16-glucosidase [Pseudopedobacter saltans DSM 12145]
MLTKEQSEAIESAKIAAEKVLLYNSKGPYDDLPRTAGWGYPEPYTRDLLFSILGIAVTQNEQLHHSIKRVLEVLALNQTKHGHIPSIINDPKNVGASDTTPLFLMATGIYRKITGYYDFLQEATTKALSWMAHQNPTDHMMAAQQPTSDWRDEQWVLGYGLYVNTLYYSGLQLLGLHKKANQLANDINKQLTVSGEHYALWVYKLYNSNRFDLLGNSLAIISGIASPKKAKRIISWIENSCKDMMNEGLLGADLPPNFFPFIHPKDPDWHPRYEEFNLPGDYHNGGIWPFICGLYIAALVSAKEFDLAEKKLLNLTHLVKKAVNRELEYGFNEWIKSQSGLPQGQDWQTWSAALYLYAAKCVETKTTPFFDHLPLKHT